MTLFSFKRAKSRLAAFSVLAVAVASTCLGALADTVGYIDYDEIRDKYEKAQELIADIKVKEADLRKTQADFVKRIEDSRKANAKNPLASKNLESQLKTQFENNVREFNTWSKQRLESIDNEVNATIKTVAQRKGVNVVVDERTVVYGGMDLTAEVVNALNAKP